MFVQYKHCTSLASSKFRFFEMPPEPDYGFDFDFCSVFIEVDSEPTLGFPHIPNFKNLLKPDVVSVLVL